MQVAIVIYEGFTSLDAAGPFEVLSRLPDADVRFVSPDGSGQVVADQPAFSLCAERLDDVPAPDIIVVAGGSTTQSYLADTALFEWLRSAHATSRWTTSVCTGSMILGAAGIIDGRRATSHWYELDSLRVFGAVPTTERVVVEGRVITSAGVSSGIDMALHVCSLLEGPDYSRCVQLAIEYDPQPPYDSGSLATASPEVARRVRLVFEESYGPTWAERQG